jgi:branched-chain amino acid transport system ATP-binding protein
MMVTTPVPTARPPQTAVDQVMSVAGLSVQFAGLHALDEVSLTIGKGEVLGLIGPNGAGKTTLTNALTGFQRYAGSVWVDGVDVTGWSPQRLARFGIRRSFQNARLFTGMTVYENVEAMAWGIRLPGAAVAGAVDKVLDWFELGRFRDARAETLPYGVQRRLGIGRALVGDPRYALLDEPAAGLNEHESDLLLEQLRRVPAEFDCGLMVIEHDMRLIMRLCQRLQVIDYGRTLAVGPPSDVRKDPSVIAAYLGTEAGGADA